MWHMYLISQICSWGFCSSGIRRRVTEWSGPHVSRQREVLTLLQTPKSFLLHIQTLWSEDSTRRRKVGTHSYPWGTEASDTLFSKLVPISSVWINSYVTDSQSRRFVRYKYIIIIIIIIIRILSNDRSKWWWWWWRWWWRWWWCICTLQIYVIASLWRTN